MSKWDRLWEGWEDENASAVGDNPGVWLELVKAEGDKLQKNAQKWEAWNTEKEPVCICGRVILTEQKLEAITTIMDKYLEVNDSIIIERIRVIIGDSVESEQIGGSES